ncbi:MAG: hypothetical protein PF450_01180 [Bacteroidales bacterium]|jgi:hypothetical protein|nr:hypothetical protein [Bacteroidales bacterium]
MDGDVTIDEATANSFIARVSGSYLLELRNSNDCLSKTNPEDVVVSPSSATPIINLTGNETFCEGDSALLSVTNDSELSYQWWKDGGVTGSDTNRYVVRTAGTYTLEVTNSSLCTSQGKNPVSISINSLPILPAITKDGNSPMCAGEPYTLSITGIGSDSYQWLKNGNAISGQTGTSLSINSTGDYRLKVKNTNNCEDSSQDFRVEVNPKPETPLLDIENYSEGSCKMVEPVVLRINNVEFGVDYQWYKDEVLLNGVSSSALTGLVDQSEYKVIANIDECVSTSESFHLDYPAMPEKPRIIVEGPNTWYLACDNINGTDYSWYYNGTEIPGANDFIYVAGTRLGKYKVGVKENTACYNYSDEIQIPLSTGIEEHPFSNLKIYPNPTPGLFTLEMDNSIMGELIIDIFGETGKQVINIKFLKETSHFQTQIDLSGQPAAVYLINLMLEEYRASRRLVVE